MEVRPYKDGFSHTVEVIPYKAGIIGGTYNSFSREYCYMFMHNSLLSFIGGRGWSINGGRLSTLSPSDPFARAQTFMVDEGR